MDETNGTNETKEARVRREELLTQALRRASHDDLARRERIKERFAKRLVADGEIEIVSSIEFIVGGMGPVGETFMVQAGPKMLARARDYARARGLDEGELGEKLYAMIQQQMSAVNHIDVVN